MDIECICGFGCIEKSAITLKKIDQLFSPCNKCKDPKFKKFKSLNDQIDLEQLDANYGRCKCGKRHLDLVMAHALKIMIDEGVRDKKSTLRNSCTPLITPAYPAKSAPFLTERSMVLLGRRNI